MVSDLKFTQAEIRLVIGLLCRNPDPPPAIVADTAEWEESHLSLLRKFGSIDTRFKRSAKKSTERKKSGKPIKRRSQT